MNKIMFVALAGTIGTIEVIHETEKTVTEKGPLHWGPIKRRKISSDRLICDTWEGAHQWLLEKAEDDADQCRCRLAMLDETLDLIKAMTPPDSSAAPAPSVS